MLNINILSRLKLDLWQGLWRENILEIHFGHLIPMDDLTKFNKIHNYMMEKMNSLDATNNR